MLAQPPQTRICSGCSRPAAGRQVELQRAAHLLAHVVDERVEHLGLVVGGQAAFLLGATGFLHAEAVRAHDLFGELLPAEREITGVGHLGIAQHGKRGAAGAEVDDRDVALHAAVRHLVREQAAGVLEREGLDVDDAGREAGRLHGCLALLDVLGAGRDEQHVEHVGIFLGWADHFEIEADLFHRKRNVLVGLHLDLGFEFVVAQVARHLDHLGDRGIAADRHGALLAAGAGALDSASHRLADGLRVNDRLLVDRILRRRFGRIRFDSI
jgi:hypothetical protein